ncbi:MAG: hypothetical protein ACO1Q7_19010 [Gemmatimonas sp.]
MFRLADRLFFRPITRLQRDRSLQRAHSGAAQSSRVMRVLLATTLSVSASVSAQPTLRAVPGVRIRPMAASAAGVAGEISAVAQLSSGMIVVGDNLSAQVHEYTASGRYLRSIGRKGRGPGEFNTVRWVGECAPNQIFVYDNALNRISVFTADGNFVRSMVPPAAQPALVRCNTDGTILLGVSTSVLPDLSQRGSFQVNDSTGKLLYRSPELLMSDGRPLGKQLSISLSPDGVAYGNGERDSFTFVSVRGEGARQVQAGIPGRVPTEINRAATIESWVSDASTPQERDRMRAYLTRAKPVAAVAAYNDIAIDPITKLVWVRTSNPGDPTTVFERRGPDGLLQGSVALPPGIDLHQVRGDVLLGKLANPVTGEQLVVSYRISR